jgi:hypothetical protein
MPINTQSHGNTQAHSEFNQRYDESITNPQDDHISADQIRNALQGATFPADKEHLTEYAKQHNAPAHIITVLQQMPTSEFGSPNATEGSTYNSIDDLINEIARVEQLGDQYASGKSRGPTGRLENVSREPRFRDTV